LPLWGWFFLFFSFYSLASCEAQTILGLSPREAAEKLRAGDIAFILDKTHPEMAELANLSPDVPFYAGILVKNRAGEEAGALKDALFEASLDGSGPVQKAAA
jgi:hypothetical protein